MRTGHTASWLVVLADPMGVQRPLPARGLCDQGWTELLSWADEHGVLPATLANLKTIARRDGARRLLDPRSTGLEPEPWFHRAMAAASAAMRQRTAMTGQLKIRSEELRQAMAKAGVPAAIIKGCDFAQRLYSHPSLRPYRDIDLLVPASIVDAAAKVLLDLGYQPGHASGVKYANQYAESSWQRGAPPRCIVELHWDLVNSPSQREAVSVRYDDLQWERQDENGSMYQRPTSASILLLGAVHAGIGHRFDRLQLLCDICQVCRGVAGAIDVDWLREAMVRTGGARALAIALHLAGDILREPHCRMISDRLRLGSLGAPWRLLLGQSLILRSTSPLNKLRRQVLREILKRAA